MFLLFLPTHVPAVTLSLSTASAISTFEGLDQSADRPNRYFFFACGQPGVERGRGEKRSAKMKEAAEGGARKEENQKRIT